MQTFSIHNYWPFILDQEQEWGPQNYQGVVEKVTGSLG